MHGDDGPSRCYRMLCTEALYAIRRRHHQYHRPCRRANIIPIKLYFLRDVDSLYRAASRIRSAERNRSQVSIIRLLKVPLRGAVEDSPLCPRFAAIILELEPGEGLVDNDQ